MQVAKNMKIDLSEQSLSKLMDEEDHKRDKDKNQKGLKRKLLENFFK